MSAEAASAAEAAALFAAAARVVSDVVSDECQLGILMSLIPASSPPVMCKDGLCFPRVPDMPFFTDAGRRPRDDGEGGSYVRRSLAVRADYQRLEEQLENIAALFDFRVLRRARATLREWLEAFGGASETMVGVYERAVATRPRREAAMAARAAEAMAKREAKREAAFAARRKEPPRSVPEGSKRLWYAIMTGRDSEVKDAVGAYTIDLEHQLVDCDLVYAYARNIDTLRQLMRCLDICRLDRSWMRDTFGSMLKEERSKLRRRKAATELLLERLEEPRG